MIATQLPPHISALLRTDVRRTTCLAEAAAWSEAKHTRGLVLHGGTGSGKTAAAAWAFQFARHRVRMSESGSTAWPVWCDARLVSAMVGHEWKHEDDWRRFDSAPIVVLDDVGIEREPDSMRALIERLWNVSSGRVVMTTNLDEAAFAERYGDRAFSRVFGTSLWITSADDDMRIDPPSGEKFRRPEDETTSECVARLKLEEDRRREEAEFEASRPKREAYMAEVMAKVRELTSAKRVAPDLEDEARVRIRRVVEQEAQYTKAAWED
jgi:hypothetical protein